MTIASAWFCTCFEGKLRLSPSLALALGLSPFLVPSHTHSRFKNVTNRGSSQSIPKELGPQNHNRSSLRALVPYEYRVSHPGHGSQRECATQEASNDNAP